jgi:hypothetical protein
MPIKGDNVKDFNASLTSVRTSLSLPAIDKIVTNGSTHPKRLIVNNATYSFI